MGDQPKYTPRPKVYNEGINGFHLWTVVTDGYGNFIAEDMHGVEIARVKATDPGDNQTSAGDMCKLVLLVVAAQDPNCEAGPVPGSVEVR